ncbi:MAG: hypothetical protein M1814_003415 [Vezdaea aestivalis]|nr:MAG: hypothetical protein M1814_003415 [Vezdaea aestivalis]
MSIVNSPIREGTPNSLIPRKRSLPPDNAPAQSTPDSIEHPPPLRSVPAVKDKEAMQREKREKKDTLKKRESKGATTDAGKAVSDPISKAASKTGKSRVPEVNSIKPIRYLFPKPLPSDYSEPPAPTLSLHNSKPRLSVNEAVTEFYEPDRVSNRKGYRFSPCIADRNFPATVFRKTELAPQRARLSFHDSSSSILFDRTITQASTDKGYRLARGNIAVREGRWYWECRVTSGIAGTIRRERVATSMGSPIQSESLEANGHVRIGWARLEASFEAPVGYDAYSYGLRDVAGQKVHMSRPSDFFPPDTSIVEGDVIGLEIDLPSLALHHKVVQGNFNPAVDSENPTESLPPQPKGFHIIRDRALCTWKSNKYFEQFEYCSTKELEDLCHPTNDLATRSAPNPTHPNPILRTLPDSKVRVYRNGQAMGEPFANLLAFLPPASKPGAPEARDGMDDGYLGYYPAVSCFRGGAVEVNFGPDFWAPPPGLNSSESTDPQSQLIRPDNRRLRPLCERYAEQVAEDTVQDIIDEIELALHPPEGTSRPGSSGMTTADYDLKKSHTSNGIGSLEAALGLDNRHPSSLLKELVQGEE